MARNDLAAVASLLVEQFPRFLLLDRKVFPFFVVIAQGHSQFIVDGATCEKVVFPFDQFHSAHVLPDWTVDLPSGQGKLRFSISFVNLVEFDGVIVLEVIAFDSFDSSCNYIMSCAIMFLRMVQFAGTTFDSFNTF